MFPACHLTRRLMRLAGWLALHLSESNNTMTCLRGCCCTRSTAGQVITVFFGSFIAGSFANQAGHSHHSWWHVAWLPTRVGVNLEFNNGGCDKLAHPALTGEAPRLAHPSLRVARSDSW